MTKYEFMIKRIAYLLNENELVKYQEDGWKLVGFTGEPYNSYGRASYVYIFRKEIEDEGEL